MDENLTRGYVQLQLDSAGVHRHTDKTSSGVRDRCHCVYLALVMCGAGFLLPYNSFITAVDYYQNKYPGTTIIFDMSFTYICVALVGVTVNNLLVDVLGLHMRITFGYVISFTTLIFVALCDIWYDVFSHNVSYVVTLVAVGIVSLGCTVQQSSFYGFTSMLPARYTQAVMTGESAAGLLVSINRILTKALLPDSSQRNTIIFFVLSTATVMICCAIFHLTRNSDFVKYYMSICKLSVISDELRNTHTGANQVTEEVSLVDILDGNTHQQHDGYGVLALNTSPVSPDYQQRFDNPPYSEVTGFDNVNYQHDLSRPSESHVTYDQPTSSFPLPNTKLERFKNGFRLRWKVAKTVWPYMYSIGLAYFVTLSLFPGIESEIISCKFKSWMPVVLIATFNLFDFIGKILASTHYEWPRTRLLLLTCARLILIPLLMLCATPRSKPVFQGEVWPISFSMLLGLSNGYFGSVPMIIAPSKVGDSQKEITGNIMMLSYSIGLTSGSIVAYFLDMVIGPHPLHPCTDFTFHNTTASDVFTHPLPWSFTTSTQLLYGNST